MCQIIGDIQDIWCEHHLGLLIEVVAWRWSEKTLFWKILQNSRGNNCDGDTLLVKLQEESPMTTKMDHRSNFFPRILWKFSKQLFHKKPVFMSFSSKLKDPSFACPCAFFIFKMLPWWLQVNTSMLFHARRG